ncbi:MAG TPA: stage V sporulation protein AD [Clostridiales bacterium]|nr:stage V sporulation protein AD [Clostridiales bacterium]
MSNVVNKEVSKMKGKQSILFKNPPYIIAASSVAGKKEGEGPFGHLIDTVHEDVLLGKDTWEEAESEFMKEAVEKALSKAELKSEDIRYLLAGDLLGQLIATSFGIAELKIPFFGLFGACSTIGEAMSLGAILIDGNFADKVIAVTSSHFASAEKQFRFPLGYGNQRPYSASWTVTGSGGVVLSNQKGKKIEGATIRIRGITVGKIVDYGIKDTMNMGAAMAPAACDTIKVHLSDMGIEPTYYDKIITGDLGYVGSDILIDLLKEENIDISKNHMDCGKEIFDQESQDTHAGGSGCACAAITFASYVIKQLQDRKWKRVLLLPTGSLHSKVSYNEGNTMPGIAHGVVIEAEG